MRKYLALSVLLLLAGCGAVNQPQSSQTACQAVSLPLVAELPAGTVDLSAGAVSPASEAMQIRAAGVFVGQHQLLTVAHAKPPAASLVGTRELKRDEKAHLLLLESDVCGKALVLSKAPMVVGSQLFDCTTGSAVGTVSGFEDSALTASPVSSAATMLYDLAVLSGEYAPGESGRPFCDAQGRLAGIVAAVREGSALLIASGQIAAFLN
jgi:hypothetical protein